MKTFRLYEELNEYLLAHLRKEDFVLELPLGATVKTILETLHIPERKNDLIMRNGFPARLNQSL